MNNLFIVALAIAIAVPAGIVGDYAARRCGALDMATGRRTEFDIAQDYGSNRGFYWPWSPLYALAMLICVVPSGFLILMFICWVLYR